MNFYTPCEVILFIKFVQLLKETFCLRSLITATLNEMKSIGLEATFVHKQANLVQENLLKTVR